MLQKKTIEIISLGVLLGILFFMAGVGITSFFVDKGVLIGWGLSIIIAGLWGVTGKNRFMVLGLVGMVAYAMGVGMMHRAILFSDKSDLRGKTISGIGVVIDDPSSGGFLQSVYVRISSCEEEEGCSGERVFLKIDKWKEIYFGDTVRFTCTFERPENFSLDFDFRMYLAGRGVRAMCEKAEVFVMEDKKTFLRYLGSARRLLEERVDQSIERPYSALGNGLLFGGSSRMSDELTEDFSKTSMTHIVAVSGYNVSLVAGYVFLLAIYMGCWRRGATIFAIAGIVLFVIFVGAPSSAIRAGVMGSILLFALALGRSRESLRVLLYAGVVMVIINPFIIRYDVGFQLSFLATFGIIALAPWYERVRPKNKFANGVAEILFMTTAAQIFVLPVILGTFHTFSLLAIVVNLFVLWTIPFAMALTLLTAILGFVSKWLGFIVGIGAQGILWYDISMVQWFAQIEWSVLRLRIEGVWFFILWYGLAGFLVFWIKWQEREERKKCCKKDIPINL